MHILPFLLMASLLPAQVKTHVEKTLAARRADPVHWQTTPIPPLPIGPRTFLETPRFIKGDTARFTKEEFDKRMDKLLEDYMRDHPDLRSLEAELKRKLHEMRDDKP